MKPLIALISGLFVAACCAAFGATRAARADTLNDIFQIQCFPELDILEVRRLEINGALAEKAIAQPNPRLEKAYGIYAPLWHDYDDTSWDERDSMNLRTHIECPLSTGAVEVTILPEWLPPRSIGFRSISVTIAVAGRTIVDDVPFVLCDYGGPITRLTYNASEGYVSLRGQFGGKAPRLAEPRLGGEKDKRRIFYLRGDTMLSAQEDITGWLLRSLPLRETDIDYMNFEPTEDADLSHCRDYIGKSNMPEARKRWFPEIYGRSSATP